jgi:hypothetical protein
MNAWMETVGAIAMAGIGFGLGKRCGRLPGHRWMVGFFLPMGVILLYGLGWRFPMLGMAPLVSWFTLGRAKFAIMGLFIALLLATLRERTPRGGDRRALVLLLVAFVGGMSIWPYLAPVFNRRLLTSLTTQINRDGICLQSTDYTCGPASAVTALRRLGLSAEEGQLAIWA